jgi:hypothetical protein
MDDKASRPHRRYDPAGSVAGQDETPPRRWLLQSLKQRVCGIGIEALRPEHKDDFIPRYRRHCPKKIAYVWLEIRPVWHDLSQRYEVGFAAGLNHQNVGTDLPRKRRACPAFAARGTVYRVKAQKRAGDDLGNGILAGAFFAGDEQRRLRISPG